MLTSVFFELSYDKTLRVQVLLAIGGLRFFGTQSRIPNPSKSQKIIQSHMLFGAKDAQASASDL